MNRIMAKGKAWQCMESELKCKLLYLEKEKKSASIPVHEETGAQAAVCVTGHQQRRQASHQQQRRLQINEQKVLLWLRQWLAAKRHVNLQMTAATVNVDQLDARTSLVADHSTAHFGHDHVSHHLNHVRQVKTLVKDEE